VTLTYSPEHVPKDGSLRPRDAQLWLKRLRKALWPQTLRFFLVGEYGDETRRPHYHAAVFGVDPVVAGGSDGVSGVVKATWGAGHTYVGDLTRDSASYIAGYVTKKIVKHDDPFFKDHHREFARMSNGGRTKQGGIGALAMEDVAKALSSGWGEKELEAAGDVPMALMNGRKSIPLGRYLRRKLREKLGFLSTGNSQESLEKFGAEMRKIFEEEIALKTDSSEPWTLGKIFVDMNRQKVLNLEGRTKIYEARRSV